MGSHLAGIDEFLEPASGKLTHERFNRGPVLSVDRLFVWLHPSMIAAQRAGADEGYTERDGASDAGTRVAAKSGCCRRSESRSSPVRTTRSPTMAMRELGRALGGRLTLSVTLDP